MQKNQKYNIINWILGNLFIMLGVAFATKASFGLSMIAAGPYILHVWLHPVFSWFIQGTAEYFYEAVLLAVLCIILREFKLKYLLSFAEAFIVGLILDGWLFLLTGKPTGIGIGTVVTTLLNSTIIDKWGNLIDKVEARHSAEKVQ